MIETPFGVASEHQGKVTLYATRLQLWDWAHRPNEAWPCSELACRDEIEATFDSNGDLVALEGDDPENLSSDELNAWSSDVLRIAGFADHPAIR